MRSHFAAVVGVVALSGIGFVLGSWKAVVAGTEEPGERLIVTGRVLEADGRTPAAKIRMMVYQTDKNGDYGPRSGSPRNIARLRGSLTTGPEGQYEIWTIRPGAYPNRNIPAHIHYVITTKNGNEHSDELEFSDDPLVDALKIEKNSFGPAFAVIQQPVKDAKGVWRVRKDVVLRKE